MHAPLTHNFVQRYGRTEGDRMSESRRWGKESIYWSKYLYIVLVKLAKESRQSNNFSTNLGDVSHFLYVSCDRHLGKSEEGREGGDRSFVPSFFHFAKPSLPAWCHSSHHNIRTLIAICGLADGWYSKEQVYWYYFTRLENCSRSCKCLLIMTRQLFHLLLESSSYIYSTTSNTNIFRIHVLW